MEQQETAALAGSHRDMLLDGLRRIFGDFNQDMLDRILPHFQWVELEGGEVLFRQGERDDSLYFVISGRLQASRLADDGTRSPLGEIARGETVGELAFFTQEPRSATVAAIRDSVLARFTSSVFRELLVAYPMVSLNLTRLVIERMQRASANKGRPRPVTIGIVAATDGIDLDDCAHRLATELASSGRGAIIDAKRVDELLGRPGASQTPMQDLQASRALLHFLEQVETENQFVVFITDRTPTEWTRRSLRHCDHVLLFADARRPQQLSPVEEACLTRGHEETHAGRTLVLVHPADTRMPSGTAAWLQPRAGTQHFHLRQGQPKDWARLGRVIAGTSTGLVLSGGGAKGFAHLGVMRALEEAGIDFDLVGGTSIGSAMGALAAMDLTAAEAIERARAAFRRNPTGDFNLLPMVSLISGKRLRQAIDMAVGSVMGEDGRIEDLWKGYFCVSSNYTAARETVLTTGPLAKSIRASVSIPGALPPVMLDGELHIDGGTFNNFPTDVMARMGAGRIVGVNLLREGSRRYKMEEVPGAWRLAFDKFRGKRHRLPGLVPLLLNTSIMSSLARQGEARRLVDIYFAPPVYGCGMLDWGKFDRIVNAGYEYAKQQLEATASGAAAQDAEPVPIVTDAGFAGASPAV